MRSPIRSLPSSPCKSSPPPLPDSQKKTLCISVFRTIIHTSLNPPPGAYDFSLDLVKNEKTSTLYVILRPGLHEFLHAAKKACFEIVTFTWWPQKYVSQILNQIDPNGQIITHKLFHNYFLKTGNRKAVMDLTLTGRMKDRSVIIDKNPNLCVKQWRNAIKVSPFTGDNNDDELWRLFSFFQAQGNFIDVRNLVHVCSKAPPMPGLPLPPTTQKTLFLDLDETLIRHIFGEPPDRYDFATEMCYVIKRFGMDKLLQVATDCGYQIVIMTASVREYASPIIDRIDPNGLIAHRLYRDSCKRNKRGMFIKDLSLTGRRLDRCIIIDDIWQRVLQRENVVRIKPFKGDMKDTELKKVLHFFHVESRYEDLRDAVSYVNKWFGHQDL
ncbi:phosphatase PSR2 [Carex littledalei]|uniref:Mitochondrial import inner membrane translocase subunit TIM50 n=1 Tax=Carex littledalei TaxID=544730 RepID=A0A833RV90_9POAL|nr:phosphatase PSR2 [Carex littledalei]